MRVLHNTNGRIRYYCRNKAQGLGCTGRGSFLDVYEEQVAQDLGAFVLPADWKRYILGAAAAQRTSRRESEDLRQSIDGRLTRLKELYTWGDLTRAEYQEERRRLEAERAQLQPVSTAENHLDALAAYLESLPAAWGDATPEQRNQLANILYEEVWVDGPVVEYVKPRPELEPLFQVRTGAAQPIAAGVADDCHTEKWQRRPRWGSGQHQRTSLPFDIAPARCSVPYSGEWSLAPPDCCGQDRRPGRAANCHRRARRTGCLVADARAGVWRVARERPTGSASNRIVRLNQGYVHAVMPMFVQW